MNGMFRRVAVLGMFAVCSLLPLRASAWDGAYTGGVGAIEIGQKGTFNVTLAGDVTLCPQMSDPWGRTHAFVSPSSVTSPTPDGIKALLSTLTAAKFARANVMLFTSWSASDGYCYLEAIQVVP